MLKVRRDILPLFWQYARLHTLSCTGRCKVQNKRILIDLQTHHNIYELPRHGYSTTGNSSKNSSATSAAKPAQCHPEATPSPSVKGSSNIISRNQTAEEKRQHTKAKKEARRQLRIDRQQIKLAEEAKRKAQSKPEVYRVLTPPGEKKDVSCPLPAAYSPIYVEEAWYDWWLNEGFFQPENIASPLSKQTNDNTFVMALPPPNVTGTLHLGHALGNSIQDAIARWHRMHGRQVLWNPGSDHAGIATQVVVEKQVWKEQGKNRHELGRERFLEEVWKWKREKGNVIYGQMKRLGLSLDWSRDRFTLDKQLSEAVTEAFIQLHNEGLIYRGKQLVNWSCALKSAISDIEVDNFSINGKTYLDIPGYDKKVPFGQLTSFAYPIADMNEEVVVSTTRPETMLGDMAIAVHPNDDRYTKLHGKFARHPLCNRSIPIVLSEHVDPNFGTGAVKITPAHDQNDYDVAKNLKLDFLSVIDGHGNMYNVPEPFQGMKRFDARKAVLQALQDLGLSRGIQSHPMVLPLCSRSQDVIEPLLKEQWYVDCADMAQQAIKVVKKQELKLIPDNYEKQWCQWLENARPWCISRQLWWGHRIPAYRVRRKEAEHNEVLCWVSGRNHEEAMHRASIKVNIPADELSLQQDEDVLDTWFSSALFPFSIHGWPEQTSDLQQFYPTHLMETASDIMYFWVARMVMMGLKLTGTLPFKEVLFHAILQDAHGRKMSKSLGNVLDPMDVIQGVALQELQEKIRNSNLSAVEMKKAEQGLQRDLPLGIPECGADALRFTLCSYNYKAQCVNVDVSHIKSNRNFCNKVWQAHKFIMNNLGTEFKPVMDFQLTGLETATDLWILSRLSNMVLICHESFTSYDLNVATQALKNFWWFELCNVYLEYSKSVFQSEDPVQVQVVRQILYTCLETSLHALSPFMPYLTEELYQRLPQREDVCAPSICVAPYPTPEEHMWQNINLDQEMDKVRGVINQVLSLRKDLNLTKKQPRVHLLISDPDLLEALSNHHAVLTTLCRSSRVDLNTTPPQDDCYVLLTENSDVQIFMQLQDQKVEELHSLIEREGKLQAEIQKYETKYASMDVEQAQHLRAVENDKVNGLQSSLQRIQQLITALSISNQKKE